VDEAFPRSIDAVTLIGGPPGAPPNERDEPNWLSARVPIGEGDRTSCRGELAGGSCGVLACHRSRRHPSPAARGRHAWGCYIWRAARGLHDGSCGAIRSAPRRASVMRYPAQRGFQVQMVG